MSSSSFRMFMCARSEQYDLIGSPTYLLIIWRWQNLTVSRNGCLIFSCFWSEQLRNMPRGWGFSSFYRPGVSGFRTFFLLREWEIRSSKKMPGGFAVDGLMVMRLYEWFSRNCQKSMFILAYGHFPLDGTPFI